MKLSRIELIQLFCIQESNGFPLIEDKQFSEMMFKIFYHFKFHRTMKKIKTIAKDTIELMFTNSVIDSLDCKINVQWKEKWLSRLVKGETPTKQWIKESHITDLTEEELYAISIHAVEYPVHLKKVPYEIRCKWPPTFYEAYINSGIDKTYFILQYIPFNIREKMSHELFSREFQKIHMFGGWKLSNIFKCLPYKLKQLYYKKLFENHIRGVYLNVVPKSLITPELCDIAIRKKSPLCMVPPKFVTLEHCIISIRDCPLNIYNTPSKYKEECIELIKNNDDIYKNYLYSLKTSRKYPFVITRVRTAGKYFD